MGIDSDIRDQAYQFFIQEAPELLQLIETELLTLRTERSTAKVHNMMRAAHSIKGGAASVGLETIKTLAHSLEDIFKSLHSEELTIDAEVEGLLLSAYDCLRLPLIEQVTTGQFNSQQAMAMAEPVFAQVEACLGDFLRGSANLPSSVDLGVDIALSIFQVDVDQGLERLATVISHPQSEEVAGELRALAEVFSGIAELLELPGFGEIAQATLAALEAHPEQTLQIAQIALADFRAAQEAVIRGDRKTGGAPSPALVELAAAAAPPPVLEQNYGVKNRRDAEDAIDDIPAIASLEEFANFFLPSQSTAPEEIFSLPVAEAELEDSTLTNFSADEELAAPSLEDIFGNLDEVEPRSAALAKRRSEFDDLTESTALESQRATDPAALVVYTPAAPVSQLSADTMQQEAASGRTTATPTPQLSVRVDLERLERINNLVGELSINRNSLSLQNEQLQNTIKELLQRFAKFQELGRSLRTLSDQMLVAPVEGRGSRGSRGSRGRYESPAQVYDYDVAHVEQRDDKGNPLTPHASPAPPALFSSPALFDSLEMDSYGELNSLLQETTEEMVRLEETVGDVVLLAGQSSQTLELQRQMLGNLRDEVMWARMLPLGEVLNRFPRILRDLSTAYGKPVELKLNGTGVLVDKAAIEKLYDPLLHLLRNAFDHGIEAPEVRMAQRKRAQGQIEIRAYHQGSQTIIEVRDDGQGINLDRIRSKVAALGIWSPEKIAAASPSRLIELLFEPGFSTASQVSQLSGRGVGLDVVRAQVRSLKGSVTVTSEPGQGTTFTLRIPLTLTIAKLLVCFVGNSAFALPSDSIAEILIPQPDQVKLSRGQRFLQWREQIILIHRLSELLEYSRPVPATIPNRALASFPTPEEWALPMLLLEQDEQILAIEVDRLVTEQELVIKPFGAAITPPSYIYGCTILGDGSLIPVIDGVALLDMFLSQTQTAMYDATKSELTATGTTREVTSTLLVVDDSITVRQTLVLTLQKVGYRVLQARDGREAIEQLQQNSSVALVICDIEMPNMNGFEFLTYRRQDPVISEIPVVMLTSRSGDKHRQLAMFSGANGYFTKPYIEQEFLTAIKQLVKK
ncbi:MAG: hybrid sensor histidine kinase/response regulator [Chroococcidiopsidaceae cyanobacterium CP_BM_ER_R8_30]|nr:hybrid sensor histidine kinase/response regulator [Chroococcidiopsidaceae cyanobacterium CP_BM_ER_R8_30]